MRIKLTIVIVFVVCGLLSSFCLAQNKVVVIPLQDSLSEEELRAICRGYEFAGKKPPNKYNCPPKLVFLTAEFYDGKLGGVSGADAKCMHQAGLSNKTKGRTYKAWISDAYESPGATFIKSTTPYVSTCEPLRKIANDWTDLVDGGVIDFRAAPGCDQYSTNTIELSHHHVWSYTNSEGGSLSDGYTCRNWTSNDSEDAGNTEDIRANASGLSYYDNSDPGARDVCNSHILLVCVEQ